MGWGETGLGRGGVTWGCGGSFLNSAPKNRSFHYSSIHSWKDERLHFFKAKQILNLMLD